MPSIPFESRYDGELISGRFDNISLGRVLDTLVRKAGLRVSLTDPTIATWPVSAKLRPSRLEHAVTEILQGFSYVLDAGARGPVLIVLSTPPNRPKSSLTGTTRVGPGIPAETLKRLSQPMSDSASPIAESDGATASPQTLAEFQRITVEEAQPVGDSEEVALLDPAVRIAQDQDYNEALLQRALDALGSEQRQLHSEALQQLASLKDPRASQALIEAVSRSASAAPNDRFQTVAALVRHAEETQFSDAAVVSLLQQLVSDSDNNVRSIVSQVLAEIGAIPGEESESRISVRVCQTSARQHGEMSTFYIDLTRSGSIILTYWRRIPATRAHNTGLNGSHPLAGSRRIELREE